MFEVKLMLPCILCFLSLVIHSLAQSGDTCSFQGERASGDFTIPGFCLLYRCIPGQGVTTIGCGIRVPPEGCYVVHPSTTNYPECCYTQIVCPEANQTTTSNQGNFEGTDFQDNSISQVSNQGYVQGGSGFSQLPSSYQGSSPNIKQSTPTSQPTTSLQPPSATGSRFGQQESQRGGSTVGTNFGRPQNAYIPPNKDSGSGPYYYKKRSP